MLNIIVSLLNNAAVVLAIVVAMGLILDKRSGSDVISGTIKTLLGYLVLSAGSGLICTALSSFSGIFTAAFGLTGFVAEDNALVAAVQTVLGFETSMIMVLAFVINLLIARFTKWKYVFLTGHMMFSMAGTMAIVLHQMGITGWTAVAIGAVVQGICQVLFPALAQPHIRELTGQDNVAYGFWGSSATWVAGCIGGLVGNKEKSAEEIKVPEKFGFLKDMSVLMGIVMIVVYVVVFAIAGKDIVSAYSGGSNTIIYAAEQGLQFVAGTLILLQGVRMFLGELIPAFRGISTRLIPGARPALDVPFIYSYGPVSTTLGFLTSMCGGILATVVSSFLGTTILPSVIGLYFMGGAAGVFGNKKGGLRGCLVAGFVLGFTFSIIPVLCYNLVDLSIYGISGLWFASTDSIIVLVIMRLVGKVFGL
ncbi:MAG: PTS ascorbate transporter subunit IIC [Erysipelotrichaceae bacterium]|nr:PTS ascorbate transporter subunit IIC [Erysipelotrichaceae bacterium]